MKLHGTLGGLRLTIEKEDTLADLPAALGRRGELLPECAELELPGEVDPELLRWILDRLLQAGAPLKRVWAAGSHLPQPIGLKAEPPQAAQLSLADAQLIVGSLRSGYRAEFPASLVVLGDVNPGVELIAAGHIVVTGVLRGVVHAGAQGREDAVIWARPIAAPQLRLAGVMARSPDQTGLTALRRVSSGAEVARLIAGQIVIQPSD